MQIYVEYLRLPNKLKEKPIHYVMNGVIKKLLIMRLGQRREKHCLSLKYKYVNDFKNNTKKNQYKGKFTPRKFCVISSI